MNISGKFKKVWKVEEKNGFTKINLGDSKKNKDGSYSNWTWFDCTLMGNAKNVRLNEGDTIEVTSGVINQREYNGKYYNDIVLFEIEVTGNAQPKQPEQNNMSGFQAIDDSSDIPF